MYEGIYTTKQSPVQYQTRSSEEKKHSGDHNFWKLCANQENSTRSVKQWSLRGLTLSYQKHSDAQIVVFGFLVFRVELEDLIQLLHR